MWKYSVILESYSIFNSIVFNIRVKRKNAINRIVTDLMIVQIEILKSINKF